MRKIKGFLFLFICPAILVGQELNCTVQIASPQIQGTTDKRIFETLQKSIFEFMNNRKWSGDRYTLEERIECSIFINITEKISTDQFKATIQVQSRRPVFNSSYNSLLFNHSDNDFQFQYVEFQPLDFSDNTNISNLTSVLGFYAYMIIGHDYDAFSLKGGTPYFEKAKGIVANAQSAQETGWKAFENQNNRYWLVENVLEQLYSPLRDCIYKYHREGLDLMYNNKESGRQAIVESLELLKKIHNTRPLSFPIQVFFNAKADEIVNIFSQSFPEEKAKVVNLLNDINPSNSNKYQKILAAE